jgi:hypothetical protein
MIAPTFYNHPVPSFFDLAAFCGVGGIWFATFASLLKNRSLIPLNDPRFVVAAV